MMKWSWKIGRIAGIDVFMHWTFLLLLGWIAAAYIVAGRGWLAALQGIGFILAIFGCVVLHELGHAMKARQYGIPTKDITLLPIGGLARLQRMPREPWQEFWVALAGPAVNVVIAAVLFVVIWGMGGLERWELRFFDGGNFVLFLNNLMWVNVILVVFNLIPAFPMDGGRVLRAILATRMRYVHATQVAASIGQGIAIFFGIMGLFWNPFLLFIALFVFLGAEAEARMVQMNSALEGVTVGRAMMTRFRVLSPDDTLQTAAQELLAGAQQDFPVQDDQGVVQGVLRRQDLVEGLKAGGRDIRVGDVMTRPCKIVSLYDSLEETLQSMRDGRCSSLPVVDDGELVGLITVENVGELIMLQSAEMDQDAPQRPSDAVPAA